jgi:hypothetical protein
MCTKTQKNLCGNIKCKECFPRSFGSFKGFTKNGNLIINYFNYEKNGNIDINKIARGTHTQYWFKCDVCPHNFLKGIPDIINDKKLGWCPYCVSKKLCDNKKCKMCFEKSFLSYDGKTKNGKFKRDCFNFEKNEKFDLRKLFISSNKFHHFDCDICYHSFSNTLNKITDKKNPIWCSYCGNKKLCDDKDCKLCFERSFASFKGRTKKGRLKIDLFDYKKKWKY